MTALVLALIVSGAIPATLIPIVYFRRPWRASPAGRALLVLSLGLMLLYDVTLLNRAIDYPFRMEVALAVIGLVSAGLWLLLVAIIRGRHIE